MDTKIIKSLDYLYQIYEYRLKKIRLIWCEQVLKIIDKHFLKSFSLNDFGCNYFQFYKEIKLSKKTKKVDYFGLDKDIRAVKIGLKKFPNLNRRYKICNIENYNPRNADVSIISSTLEHCNNPKKIINNMLNSTKKLIVIRTFVGQVNLCKTFNNKKKFPFKVKIRQFSRKTIRNIFARKKFKIKILKDKATKNSKSYLVNEEKKFRRKMQIVIGIKE